MRQNIFLDEIWDEFENGSCWSKARSLGQMLGKKKKTKKKQHTCVRSRGHIFSLIIMKLDVHVCLCEISHKYENCFKLGQKLGN